MDTTGGRRWWRRGKEVEEREPSWAARWRFRCFTHWTCIKFVHSIAYVVERQTRRLPVRIPERKTGKGERRRVREEGVAVATFARCWLCVKLFAFATRIKI